MSFKRIARWPVMRRLLVNLARWRVAEKIPELMGHIQPTDRILDIGSGNGVLCDALKRRGLHVTPLDVEDLSLLDEVKPFLYNGTRIPFEDDAFDVALLITVLHHVKDPGSLLAEATRVAGRVIVIEEIYSNILEKYLTYFIDSVFNFEFIGHPHSNRTDEGWRAAFQSLGLELTEARYSRSLLVLNRVTYVLDKKAVQMI